MINALPKHGYINRMVNMGLCPPCDKNDKKENVNMCP
jgi:hypothetical protein